MLANLTFFVLQNIFVINLAKRVPRVKTKKMHQLNCSFTRKIDQLPNQTDFLVQSNVHHFTVIQIDQSSLVSLDPLHQNQVDKKAKDQIFTSLALLSCFRIWSIFKSSFGSFWSTEASFGKTSFFFLASIGVAAIS